MLGRVVGITSAYDYTHGIFANLQSIHSLLDRNGLAAIFDGARTATEQTTGLLRQAWEARRKEPEQTRAAAAQGGQQGQGSGPTGGPGGGGGGDKGKGRIRTRKRAAQAAPSPLMRVPEAMMATSTSAGLSSGGS